MCSVKRAVAPGPLERDATGWWVLTGGGGRQVTTVGDNKEKRACTACRVQSFPSVASQLHDQHPRRSRIVGAAGALGLHGMLGQQCI